MTIRPLYSPGQVVAATFLGSVIGGAWLLALNDWRLAEPRSARLVVGLGVLATIAVCGFEYGFPKSQLLFPFLSMIAMYWAAKALQGKAYERHLALRGSRGSTGRAIGVGVASLVFVQAVQFAIDFSYVRFAAP